MWGMGCAALRVVQRNDQGTLVARLPARAWHLLGESEAWRLSQTDRGTLAAP